MTIIVQSSDIITANLVPLCGISIITLQQVYVMTLGANIVDLNLNLIDVCYFEFSF